MPAIRTNKCDDCCASRKDTACLPEGTAKSSASPDRRGTKQSYIGRSSTLPITSLLRSPKRGGNRDKPDVLCTGSHPASVASRHAWLFSALLCVALSTLHMQQVAWYTHLSTPYRNLGGGAGSPLEYETKTQWGFATIIDGWCCKRPSGAGHPAQRYMGLQPARWNRVHLRPKKW
jgi:hypothetical protein